MPATQRLRRADPPALPERLEDWHRNIKAERTLNDLVEDIHRILAEDATYKRYLWAVYDTQALTGSLSFDDCKASEMIQAKARELDENHELVSEKLADIARALRVVLRRYNQSRKERRGMIDGEIVPDENGD